MKTLRRIAVPILASAAFPILMLVSPTERTMIRLWAAAMLIVSFTAGHEISRVVSRRVASGWLVGSLAVLAVLMITGVLSLQQGNPLPYRMGVLAAGIVGLGVPVSALQARILRERRKKGDGSSG